ncbi:MAG: Gfo/Idh/MocA family protein [Christensenellales bacterium]
MQKIRWGIISTGWIADRFSQGMDLVPDAEKTVVVSRDMGKAIAFAKEHNVSLAYDDYDKMLEEVKPDVVYVATPNNAHYEYVIKALDAGVNVLCEKPMPDNLRQLEAMVAKAREKDLFLMEGMWTRCFPGMRKVRQWLEEGRIGQVRTMHFELGLKESPDNPAWQAWKASRQFSAGALRDVGIYTLAMAHLVMPKRPVSIASTAVLRDGTDVYNSIFMQYEDHVTACLTSAFDTVTDHRGLITGTHGQIVILPRFNRPEKVTLLRPHDTDIMGVEKVEEFACEIPSTGFQYEVEHVNECLRAGKKQSDLYSLEETYEICRIIDGLREEWGVVYDSD